MPIQTTVLNYVNPENNYVLVRSEILYYLKFINYDKDLFKDASSLTSKPTITYYTENSVNKVIIDYSFANRTDKKYLDSFFANMTQIDTFSVSSGEYLDQSELSANLNSSYTFTEYKDNKIFAKVNSVTSQNSAIDVYFGDYFIGTPQLSKTGNLGSSPVTENYALININPNSDKTLTTLGVLSGDLIEIIKTGTANNQIKYEIEEISTVKNKEVLKLKPYNGQIPVVESLVGSPVLVNVYVKGAASYTEEDISSNLGCCSDVTGTIKYKNQTRHQCKARSDAFIFDEGDCVNINSSNTVTSTSFDPNVDTAPVENKIYYVSILGYVESTGSVSVSNRTQNKSLILTDAQGILNSTGAVSLKRGISYNFIQQDPSNQNLILKIALNSDGTPFNGDAEIFSFNTQDSINSTMTVNIRDTTISTLYLICINDTQITPVKILLN